MTNWLEHLTTHGADIVGGRVLAFGEHPKQALQAFYDQGSAALVPLLSLTPLRVSGTDRLDFLHGQLSNEVKRLKPGHSNSSLMLNVKGHALALMRVFRRQDDVYLAIEDGAGKLVKTQLKAHIIFDQVELEDLSKKISTMTLQGSGARKILQAMFGNLPDDGEFIELPFAAAKLLISPARRSHSGGFDLHVLSRDAAGLFDTLIDAGASPVGEEALETARVSAGIATTAGEGGEGVLPQEAGLEQAVSYHKGCYLGQEIMARIEARGKLHKMLRGVTLSDFPAGQGLELKLAGKTVGRLGTVVRHPELGVIALASLRHEINPADKLEVGGTVATVSELPFDANLTTR